MPLYFTRALRQASTDLALEEHLWNYVNEKTKGSLTSHALSKNCSALEVEAAMATLSDELKFEIFWQLELVPSDGLINRLCESLTEYFSVSHFYRVNCDCKTDGEFLLGMPA